MPDVDVTNERILKNTQKVIQSYELALQDKQPEYLEQVKGCVNYISGKTNIDYFNNFCTGR